MSAHYNYFLYVGIFMLALVRYCRTEEPGMLQSIGSQRVGHDLPTTMIASIFAKELGNKKIYSKFPNF